MLSRRMPKPKTKNLKRQPKNLKRQPKNPMKQQMNQHQKLKPPTTTLWVAKKESQKQERIKIENKI
jgi:hypothetical protein